MRTNIVIDDRLMEEALRTTGLKTKRAAVELGLRTLVRLKRQAKIHGLRGKLNWQGDLDIMRSDVDPGGFQCVDRLFQGVDQRTD